MFGEKSYFVRKGIVVIGFLFIATVILAIGATAQGEVWVDDDADSGWYNDTHVKTIQEGINNVTQGGTVYVWNGTYQENVIVNKSITLEANLSAVLDGMGSHGMNITVNNIVVKNITVTNSTSFGPPAAAGIFIYNSSCILQNITLDNVTVTSSAVGVIVFHVTVCNISQCNFSYNTILGIGFIDTTYCNVSYNEINYTTTASGGPMAGSAVYLQNSSYNNIYDNYICNNALTGIISSVSTDNNFSNNIFVNDGIRLSGSELSHFIHTLKNNTVNGAPVRYYKNISSVVLDENNATGQVILANCTNFEIRNMTLDKAVTVDIYLAYSDNINIFNCTISNSSESGVYLLYSNNSNISSNNISNISAIGSGNEAQGIYLTYSNNNNISSNNISSNTNYGIILDNSNNNNITSSNQIFNNSYGIYFYQSNNNNIISNNEVYNNTNRGIYFSSSHNNTVTSSNYIYNNLDSGIYFDYSDGNNITSNYVYGNTNNGFNFGYSDNNTIASNQVYNNPMGICFDHSDSNNITSNYIYNSSYQGIFLGSSNSNNIRSNHIYNATSDGINLWNSSNNNITSSNHVYNNSDSGIYLGENTTNNNITSNYVYNNSHGINFGYSNNNTISSNHIYDNDNSGICLMYSDNNTITSNYVNNTSGGVWPVGINLVNSSNNTIYNNYFNNTHNVYDNGTNTWNTTKTLGTNIVGRPYLGGNFWSDYNGLDTDGDGIGDTNLPYTGTTSIDNGGDYLPLVVSSPPTQTGENPSNGSSGISLIPVLNITVDDVDGDSLTAYWNSNSTTSWALFATNTSVDTSSGSVNIIQTNSNFSLNSTTYWWSVNLTDGTHWRNVTYHFTTLYIPNPPSSFTATTFNRTQIDLSWTKGDKADKTYIEWNSIKSWARGSGTPIYNDTGISYQHTDLSFGTTYYYQAWSWNNTDNCWSTTNSSANATTNSNNAPVQSSENPTNNTGNVDKTQSTVNVTITDPDGDNFNWTIQGQYVANTNQNEDTNGSKSANLITPLPFNTNIIWYVNVTDGYNWTNATYNFTVRSQYIPNPPSDFNATKYNRTRIDISWTNAGNNKTYIERNTTESWTRGSGTFIYNGTGTSYQNTSLNGNTQYFYQAWSWNETDNVYSTTNASANATTNNTIPSLNGEIPANGSTDQQRWPACNITVTDVDGDLMNVSFYYENTTGSWVLQQTNTSVASGTNVVWSNFTNASDFSTVYNWSVNVTDGYGWANETYNFTTLSEYVPDPPSSFSASASSSSQIDLSWTRGNKADYTRIQRKTGGYPTSINDGTIVTNTTGTSKSDTGLSASTMYYYSAWSWNVTQGLWSTSYVTASATTDSGTAGPGGPGGSNQTTDSSPSISNVSHEPTTVTSEDTVTVYASVSDDYSVQSVVLYWNDGSEHSKSMSLSGGNYSATIGPFAELTTVTYRIKATDNASQSTESSTYTFTVADVSGPTITIITPTSGSIIYDTTPVIKASYSDPSSINTTSVNLSIDGSNVTSLAITSSVVAYTPSTAMTYGNHTVKLYVSDTLEYTSTKEWSFTIEETESITEEGLGNITSGETTEIIPENKEETGIEEITLIANTNLTNVKISLAKLIDKPEDITEEPANKIIYTYLNLEITTNDTLLDEENIENLTINFKVRVTWIENNSIDKETIKLLRYKDGQWQELNTTKTDEDSTYVYFEAISPGTSTFAIAGQTIVEEPPPTGPPAGIDPVLIIGAAVAIILLIIFVLFKTGVLYIEKEESMEEETLKKTEEK